jgi:Ni/Fe-hydrogenase 1 B-type cytochrome subunit
MSNVTRRPPTHPDVVVTDACVSSVKVWQPLIRLLHWSLAASVVVLSVTGFYIGNPYWSPMARWNLMSVMRMAHLITAWVFISVLLARGVLAFTGNPWARWDQIIPRHPERRKALKQTIRYYSFLEQEPAEVVGHNPMAGMVYLVVFVMMWLQAFTGIALMATSDHMHGWQHFLTGWAMDSFTPPTQRLIHHLLMWVIWGFVVTHLYAATLSDRIERSGEISSMIGGWKQLPGERVQADLTRDADRRRRRYLK